MAKRLAVGSRRRNQKKSHPNLKKIDPEKMIEVAVKRATCQPPYKNQEGMSRAADEFLAERTGMLQEEFFSRVGEKLQEITNLLLNDLVEKHDQIPPQNLAYTLSTVMDKALLISGRPQALTAQLNVGLGATGLSREDVVSALTGGNIEKVEEAK